MMVMLLILPALAADALDTLPAKLAGISGWDARAAAIQSLLDAETAERERLRLQTALDVVQLLAEREPSVERGRLRSLVQASLSKQEVPRSEARKAAALGAPLPEIPDDEGWIPRVPVPLGDQQLPAFTLAEPDLGETGFAARTDALLASLVADTRGVGWPVAEAGEWTVTGEVSALYGAVWADRPGFGVDVAWDVRHGDTVAYHVVTRGFDPGPLDNASAEVLLHGALFNLLAQDALVATMTEAEAPPEAVDDAPLEQVELSEVCLYRKKHQDSRPLTIQLGDQDLMVMAGSWGCLQLPVGLTVHSKGTPGEPVRVVAGERTVLQVAHGANAGWSTVIAEDGAAFDKLAAKGKVSEALLAPAP